MKVLRSTLVIGLAAFAAACGDKVTVAGPPTTDTAPRVNSVTVTPGVVTMSVGQTASFSAAVDVANGAATTVSWSSSDASKVSVSTAGVATAVAATPGVAICATSTADANKKGCASVVVTGTTAVPPSVSISAVNFTNGAGVQQPAPVPPGAIGTAVGVGPQLNVVMNVNAGTAQLDSVVLRVGTKTAYKQAFSASQQASLISESMKADAQSQGVLITGSFNTADYCASTNANSVACAGGVAQGTATYLNGNQNFQALVFGKQSVTAGGTPSNTQGQSPVTTYRFANLNGFHVTMSFGNGTNTPTDAFASATDAAGFKWVKGQPSVSALFVAYTPGLSAVTSVISTTATINAGGACSAGGARTVQLTNTNATSTVGPWTGTWPLNTTSGATNPAWHSGAYEYNPALCPAAFVAGGDIVSFAAIGSDGNAIPLAGPAAGPGVGVLNTFASSNNPDPAIVFRLDNVAPPAPAIRMASATWGATATGSCVGAVIVANSLSGRTNCWFNGAVTLNGLGSGAGSTWPAGVTTTSTGIILSGADVGSGRVITGVGTVLGTTFTARAGTVGTANATIDASTAITGVSGLPESATNIAYQLRIQSTDILGNTANRGATGAVPWQFGVDLTQPALSLAGGNPHGTRIYATPAGAGGTNYNILATDPSTLPAIGSGFFNLGANPLTTTQTLRNAAGSLNWCGPGAAAPPGPVVGGTGVYQTSSTACATAISATGTGAFNTNLTYSDTHASTVDGYYLATNTIIDQAGNVSPTFSLLSVQDGSDAAWGGLSYTPAIIPPGGSINFNSTVGDNVDVQAIRLSLGYGTNGGANALVAPLFDAATAAPFAPTTAAGGATFWQYVNGPAGALTDLLINPCPAPAAQPNALCTTWPASLVTNTNISYPVTSVFTNLQTTAAAVNGNGPFVYNVGNNLMTASGFAFNQGVNIGVTPLAAPMQATVGIPLGAVSPALTLIGNTGVAGDGPVNWVICAVSTTGNCNTPALTNPPTTGGAQLPATFTTSRTGAGGVPTSVTLTAVAEGNTAVFDNPYSAVQFYAYNPTAGLGTEGWRLIGTLTNATSTTDLLGAVPNGRNWYFTLTWTPNLVSAPNNAVYKVMAVGITNQTRTAVGSRGAALASPIAFTTVTVTP